MVETKEVNAALGRILATPAFVRSPRLAQFLRFAVEQRLSGRTDAPKEIEVGVKSTRLRSISGEQIILANADVLKARVRNYGRMRERRSAFRLNVTYDTPPEKLREIPAAVRAVIEAEPQTRFDRCHFLAFGDWSLQFEVVYYVTVSDYRTYADLQQTINLGILERFEALDVDIAFVSHSVHTLPPPKKQPSGA